MLRYFCAVLTRKSGAIKGTINQERAIPVIYEILRNHKGNLEIVLRAVTLLNQISTRSMLGSWDGELICLATTRVAVAKEGGVQVILDILYAHEGQHDMQSMCLRLIDILCTLSMSLAWCEILS